MTLGHRDLEGSVDGRLVTLTLALDSLGLPWNLLRVLRLRVARAAAGVHALGVVAVDQFVRLLLEAGWRGCDLLLWPLLLLLLCTTSSRRKGKGLSGHVGCLRLLVHSVLIDGGGR